jgi:type IV pilus assembly protein PilM
VAAAATLLFGFAASTAGYSNVYQSVSEDRFGTADQGAIGEAEKVASTKSGFESAYNGKKTDLEGIQSKEDQLVEPLDTREYWLEVYAAIDACLPRDTGDAIEIENIEHKQRINLRSVTCKKYDDLGEWFSGLADKDKQHMSSADKETPPEGEGYVFTLIGHHYFNDPKFAPENYGILFVRNTLLKRLQSFEVKPEEDWPFVVPVGKLGISHPTILQRRTSQRVYDPEGHKMRLAKAAASRFTGGGSTSSYGGGAPTEGYAGEGGGSPYGTPPGGGTNPYGPTAPGFSSSIPGYNSATPGLTDIPGLAKETGEEVQQMDFVMQFVWKPTPVEERPETDPALAAEDGTEQPTQ